MTRPIRVEKKKLNSSTTAVVPHYPVKNVNRPDFPSSLTSGVFFTLQTRLAPPNRGALTATTGQPCSSTLLPTSLRALLLAIKKKRNPQNSNVSSCLHPQHPTCAAGELFRGKDGHNIFSSVPCLHPSKNSQPRLNTDYVSPFLACIHKKTLSPARAPARAPPKNSTYIERWAALSMAKRTNSQPIRSHAKKEQSTHSLGKHK